jgi:outer membrane protein assembly factor BamB
MPSRSESADSRQRRLRRRRFLAAGAGLLTGLAGCSGERDTPTETDPEASPEGSPGSSTEIPTEPGDNPSLRGPWPTIHADPRNTGTVDAAGPEGTPSVHWQTYVHLETGMWVSDGPNGPVAVREDGLLVAYDADGGVRWRRRHDGGFTAGPVVADDGTVVVGTRQGVVRAYASDGSERWRDTTPEGVYAPHANDATPFSITGDVVLLAHPRKRLVAYDIADGSRRWDVEVPARCHRPAIENGRVYLVGEGDDRRSSVVQSRSLADGSTHWEKTTERSIRIGAGVANGTVYLGDIDGVLVARDAENGSEQWRVELSEQSWISTLPVEFEGNVWVGTLSDGIFAVSEKGVQTHIEMGTSTTPVTGDGRLYIGSTEFGGTGGPTGKVIALDADGNEQWQTTTRGNPNALLAYRDGTVYAASETGTVGAFAAASGDLRWRRYERPATLPSPVVGDGAVYCGSRRSWVGGYRATDGTSHLWGVSFDSPAPGAPVVASDTVVAGSHGGVVTGTPAHEYADPPNGRLTVTPSDTGTDIHIDAPKPDPLWRTRLAGPVGDIGYGNGGAYLGSGDSVAALTVAGDVRWETGVGERVSEAPAVADGTVYAVTAAGTLFALDTADGQKRWRESVGDAATAPVATSANGKSFIVVGTNSGVVAVEAGSGEERWRAETGKVQGSPAVTEELVVFGDGRGVLYGIDLGSGDERWTVETGGAIHGAPALADGVAHVGSRDGHLYAVDTADGSVRWRVELGDWVDCSPAIGYGAVFVVDQSGRLSAVVGDG